MGKSLTQRRTVTTIVIFLILAVAIIVLVGAPGLINRDRFCNGGTYEISTPAGGNFQTEDQAFKALLADAEGLTKQSCEGFERPRLSKFNVTTDTVETTDGTRTYTAHAAMSYCCD